MKCPRRPFLRLLACWLAGWPVDKLWGQVRKQATDDVEELPGVQSSIDGNFSLAIDDCEFPFANLHFESWNFSLCEIPFQSSLKNNKWTCPGRLPGH